MKKEGAVFILIFISMFSLASAAEIKLSKDIYQPSETLQAQIYGNFLDPIKPENIHFYRERNIPVEYDILQLSDRYIVYALLPDNEGNYSITLEDVRHEESHIVTDEPVSKEFIIQKGNVSYLTINPGFVTAREDFYITIESKKSMQIEAKFLGETQEVSLIGEKEKRIYFSIAKVTNYTITNISILSYEIPVVIIPNQSNWIEDQINFRFNPVKLETAILKGSKLSFVVALVNYGLKNITSISLSQNSSISIQLNPTSISLIESKEKKFINLTVSSEKNGNYTGKIIASSSNFTTELDLIIMVTDNRSQITAFINKSNGSTGYGTEKSCSEMNGSICINKETCTGVEMRSTEGSCCLAKCTVPTGDSTWIYGIVIIVVLVGGLIGFSFYMKKKQGIVPNFLKKREDKFQNRMSGPTPPPSTEVRGTLSKT